MYNFKVPNRYSEEEENIACAHDKPLKKEETWGIRLDSGILDLAITQRLQWCDKIQYIAAYTEKVQLLQEDAAIYEKRTVDSATRLKDWVVVQDPEHLICHTKFDTADQLSGWILYSPESLSYWCNLSGCDFLWAPLSEFIGFCNHSKGCGWSCY